MVEEELTLEEMRSLKNAALMTFPVQFKNGSVKKVKEISRRGGRIFKEEEVDGSSDPLYAKFGDYKRSGFYKPYIKKVFTCNAEILSHDAKKTVYRIRLTDTPKGILARKGTELSVILPYETGLLMKNYLTPGSSHALELESQIYYEGYEQKGRTIFLNFN
jgi:protoporphyrinogen oxidase